MPNSKAKNTSSVVEVAISGNGSVREVAQKFVEEAKANTGIIDASLLPSGSKGVTRLTGRATERVRLELDASATAALLGQIMRLVLPRRDIIDTETTVALSSSTGQSVELDGSLPDGEYLEKVKEILELMSD